jgi:hypothetical protein
VHLGEHSSSKVMADMSAALATSRYRYFNKWSGQPVARLVSLIGAIGSLLRAMAWAGATSLRIERSRARMAAHIAAARVGVRAFVHPHEFAYP